jgi:hypothetical protein
MLIKHILARSLSFYRAPVTTQYMAVTAELERKEEGARVCLEVVGDDVESCAVV